MTTETLKDLRTRAHQGQWDFDQLLRWYHDLTQEVATLTTQLAQSDARVSELEEAATEKQAMQLRALVQQRSSPWQPSESTRLVNEDDDEDDAEDE